MQVEREIKFSLSPEALARVRHHVRPAGPWRRRTVSSAYYDTKNELLRRAGVALRFRREGARRLQTLKAGSAVQAGLATRSEWELPAPGGRLEVGAFPRAEIMAATGVDLHRVAAKLQPVFETRFTRRSAPVALDAAARAELCVDVGYVGARGRREPISELEIELKTGDPRALLRYAERLSPALGLQLAFESKAERGYRLASGRRVALPRKWPKPALAESATPGEAFAALAAASIAQAGANARGVVHAADPEYLHQLRVGLRRLRSALRAFRSLVGTARPLVRRLRKLSPPLGEARDWDVFVAFLQEISAGRELLARARARRSGARRKARETAASSEFQLSLLRALRWLYSAPRSRRAATVARSLAAFGARSLERLQRKTLEQAQGLERRDVAARHALRIRVKRLRYGCEFFASSFPRASVRPYVESLETLQDILGELNDVAVGRRLLQTLGPHASASRVRRELAMRERRLIASLEPAWRAFKKHRPFWRARG
jgi:inorganic triphosphatase YgiF